jgi:hypothetical protein
MAAAGVHGSALSATHGALRRGWPPAKGNREKSRRVEAANIAALFPLSRGAAAGDKGILRRGKV